VSPLSSADGPGVPPDTGGTTDTVEPEPTETAAAAPVVEPEPEPTDEVRLAMRAAVVESLGDAVLGSRIIDAGEVIIRVATPAWAEVAKIARHKLHCGYFCFLNGIDWLP
jgi:hypothetical protein